MIKVNAIGDVCPIPVVKTKKAIESIVGNDIVETLVDNEIAVANVTKLAQSQGYKVESEKVSEKEFKIVINVDKNAVCDIQCSCKKNIVVSIGSSCMGIGSDELGKTLLKGFIYALTQQDELPTTILFYNGGACMSCEESPALEDLKALESQGVEILTCGTCLNYYGLSEKLQVGQVTNMYVIVEKLSKADLVIKP